MSAVTLRSVPTDQLVANRRNVREALEDIDQLAASIRANGLLQPIIVNDRGGRLVVTDGHRRLEAARLAGMPTLMCLVTTDADTRRVTTTMLAAAMHKELRPLEQARAFKALQDQGVIVAEIARSTGYSQALIRGRLLLLELPAEAQDMVEDEELTIGQATELAKQVRAQRSGGVASGKRGGGRHYWRDHRLAKAVYGTCTHRDTHVTHGNVGCSACWEKVIRADERGEVIEVPPLFDEAVVVRVLSGERLTMRREDRLECVRRLVRDRLSDNEIAIRVHVTIRQILRDRQDLGLDSPIGNKPWQVA